MQLRPLILSMLGIFASTYSHSAAMDQSGQSILAFLEEKNYFEANATTIDPDISGKVRDLPA